MTLKLQRKTAEIPEELRRVLEDHSEAADAFHALSPSHQNEYVKWVAGAKQPETKRARALKAIEMVRSRKASG